MPFLILYTFASWEQNLSKFLMYLMQIPSKIQELFLTILQNLLEKHNHFNLSFVITFIYTHIFPYLLKPTYNRSVTCLTSRGGLSSKEAPEIGEWTAKRFPHLEDCTLPEGRNEKSLWTMFSKLACRKKE